MDTTEIIETGLKKIKAQFMEFEKFQYTYPTEIVENAILFIGINPSTTGADINGYKLEQKGHKMPYFRKMQEIASYCSNSDEKLINIKWSHLDLLFFKETNQSTIHEILKTQRGVEYIYKQLLISDKLIKAASPKVIVVSNALARKFLGKDEANGQNKWLDYEFEFDENIGTYKWNNIPVFFSGMLSGQRALDIGSLERLKWHIKSVLKN